MDPVLQHPWKKRPAGTGTGDNADYILETYSLSVSKFFFFSFFMKAESHRAR